MRPFFVVMLMLLMFTTTQVAAAFERCDEPSCSDYLGSAQKKAGDSQKKDGAAPHCAVGCHSTNSIPQQTAPALRSALHSATVWAERPIPESALGQRLIEPPSLA